MFAKANTHRMHITDGKNGTIRLDFIRERRGMKREHKQSLGIFKTNVSTNHLNLTFCLLVFYVYIVLNYLIFHSLYIMHIDFFCFSLCLHFIGLKRVGGKTTDVKREDWKRRKDERKYENGHLVEMLINLVPQSLKSADIRVKLQGFSLNSNNAL